MALYRVLSTTPIMYEGDWHAKNETFEAAPPDKAKYHRDDKLAETIADYLERGLIEAV